MARAELRGKEVNARLKPEARVRVLLIFPDVYEIGMSNLGLAILYELLNDRLPDFWAQRGYFELDGGPVLALESGWPLRKFHVVGFSLQTELNFTNILEILKLGEVPLFRWERGEGDPLVIAGGPGALNPWPTEAFVDAFFIGEAEESLLEAAEAFREWARGAPRREVLEELAKIEGVWVPGVSEKPAKRRWVKKLPLAPVRPPVPYEEIVHDRYTLELARGCLAGCRFCEGGFTSRPLRVRSLEDAKALALEGIRGTGWEEIGLAAFSISEYPWLPELVEFILRELPGVRMAVPSLPADRLEYVLDLVQHMRTSSFTIAPETGSERLLRVINKPVDLDAARRALDAAERFRVKHVKMYFMLGLPTETDEDLEQTGLYLRELARTHRKIALKASFAPFTPRPFTPFQWEPMITPEEAWRRVKLVRKVARARNLRITFRNPEKSAIQGILARGGPGSWRIVYEAWQRGALHDHWSERLKLEAWLGALEALGLSLEELLGPKDEAPWARAVDVGVLEGFLRLEAKRAKSSKPTGSCRDGRCRGCGFWWREGWRWCKGISPEARPVEKPEGIRWHGQLLVLRKRGLSRWLTGTEFINAVLRALRRSGYWVRASEGFVARPRVSASPSPPVGVESYEELLWVETDKPVERAEFPDGIELVEIRKEKPDWSKLRGSVYLVDGRRVEHLFGEPRPQGEKVVKLGHIWESSNDEA